MYRIGAVIAVAGIALAVLGVLTSTGWMILTGVAVLVVSVVMGALTQRPRGRSR